MRRLTVLIACLLALLAAGGARAGTQSEFAGHHTQVFRVVVVPYLGSGDLEALAQEGAAIGLLVPNAGPSTSGGDAFAGMVRGVLYNARLAKPRDSILIHVEHSYVVPDKGPAIIVALPPQRPIANTKRYGIAVLGGGYHGVLVSKLTRVPGLVSMADVARTALGTKNRLRWQPSADAPAALRQLESHIEASRGSTMGGSVLVLSLLVFFALFYPTGAAAALATALAANLGLGWLATTDSVSNVVLLGVCLVAGGVFGPRLLRTRTALGVALAAVLVAYAVALAIYPPALSLAPMGPELTSRFYGVSNLIETLLLAPALLAAKLLGERLGAWAFAAVALLTMAAIAENRLGADGGGAFVVGVAFAVLAVAMWAKRWITVVPALLGAGLAAFLALDVDAATSSSDHLSGALHGGIRGLERVAVNRVPLSYERILQQWWLVFPALGALAVVAVVARSSLPRAHMGLVVALLAGLAASILVNDSPGQVVIAGLASLLVLEGGLVHRGLTLPVLRRVGVHVRIPLRSPRPQE